MGCEILILDYGMGNIQSIKKKLEKYDVKVNIGSDEISVLNATKIIIPGVGNFLNGMNNLNRLGLIEVLNKKAVHDKIPILGICLGMQLMSKFSEEGFVAGLGWINSEVVRFKIKDKIKYKVPHIGWNTVTLVNSNKLSNNINANDKFYFIHSYHLVCNNKADIWMSSNYEYDFVSAIKRGNLYGTQFHPEKSHESGEEILKEFINI